MRHNGKPQLALDDPQAAGSDAGAIVQSGGTLQQTQTAYSTAVQVQKPRAPKRVLAAVCDEAALCGEGFWYSWSVKDKNSPTGKSLIEGVSIDGAMILARNWGNCAVPIGLEADAPQHWVLSADFVDLETGFNVRRLFRQRKNQKSSGKMDAERSLDIAFQIGQSKAQRNVILKAMPEWLVTQALDAARDSAEGKYKDVKKHAPRFIDRFKAMGVTEEQLERKLGRKVAYWEPRDLVTLAAIGRAIKDRQTTVEHEFAEERADEAQAATEADAQPSEPTAGTEEAPLEGDFVEEPQGGGDTSPREPGEEG